MKKLALAACGVAMMLIADAANAAVVVNSLPTYDTTEWTRGAMNPGNTGTNSAGETVMDTYPYGGNWFGWGVWYSNTPSWTPGDSSAGNHLSLTARFGAHGTYGGPKDWNTYFYDNSHVASINYNPTYNCDPNNGSCYAAPTLAGVSLLFGNNTPQASYSQFVALDTSVNHTYEFLLKNGQVSYRIDGQTYNGQAYAANIGAKLLVIGDGSGSTPTGSGTMVINAVSFDNAPTFDILPNTAIPEPAAWAMMLGGFGLAGTALRRRRRAVSFA